MFLERQGKDRDISYIVFPPLAPLGYLFLGVWISSPSERGRWLSLSGSCCAPLPLLLPGRCFRGRCRSSCSRSAQGSDDLWQRKLTPVLLEDNTSHLLHHHPFKTPATKLLWGPPDACTTQSPAFDLCQKGLHQLHLFKSILTRLCRYFTAWTATVQVRSFYSNPKHWIPVLSSRCYCPSQGSALFDSAFMQKHIKTI